MPSPLSVRLKPWSLETSGMRSVDQYSAASPHSSVTPEQ